MNKRITDTARDVARERVTLMKRTAAQVAVGEGNDALRAVLEMTLIEYAVRLGLPIENDGPQDAPYPTLGPQP